MNVDTVWQDGISLVALVQVYTNWSSTTTKASGMAFYPLHLCLLNVGVEVRKKLIVTGDMIVAYLPCYFDTITAVDGD